LVTDLAALAQGKFTVGMAFIAKTAHATVTKGVVGTLCVETVPIVAGRALLAGPDAGIAIPVYRLSIGDHHHREDGRDAAVR
jgi:hypothetical protein